MARRKKPVATVTTSTSSHDTISTEVVELSSAAVVVADLPDPLPGLALQLLEGFGVLDQRLRAQLAEIAANPAVFEPIRDAAARAIAARLSRPFVTQLATLAAGELLRLVQSGESLVETDPVDLA